MACPSARVPFSSAIDVIVEPKTTAELKIKETVGYADKAWQEGIVSLDNQLESIDDPFLKKALMLAVDGTEPQELRSIMDVELDCKAEREEQVPKHFESAGDSPRPSASSVRFWDSSR